MTWSYSGNPSSSGKDEVRFLIGDTDTNSQLVSDEEIAYAIAASNTNLAAAIRVARAIALKFSRMADKKVGDLSISYGARAKAYWDLVEQLETKIDQFSSAQPYAGGISQSDKETQEDDTDRVNPSFKRGMHDFQDQDEDKDDLV